MLLSRGPQRHVATGAEAVAIGFLHSHANPAHELQAAAQLKRLRPHLGISTCAKVAPELREYERFATACVNAYMQPLMAGYLGRLETALAALGLDATRPWGREAEFERKTIPGTGQVNLADYLPKGW